MIKTIAFVGPMPPPVGGVALANMRFQRLLSENNNNLNIIQLNTSRGLKNADLYRKILKKINKIFFFIYFSFILTNPIVQKRDIIRRGNHIDKNSGIFSFSPRRLEK